MRERQAANSLSAASAAKYLISVLIFDLCYALQVPHSRLQFNVSRPQSLRLHSLLFHHLAADAFALHRLHQLLDAVVARRQSLLLRLDPQLQLLWRAPRVLVSWYGVVRYGGEDGDDRVSVPRVCVESRVECVVGCVCAQRTFVAQRRDRHGEWETKEDETANREGEHSRRKRERDKERHENCVPVRIIESDKTRRQCAP